MLSQGRFWRVQWAKAGEALRIGLQRDLGSDLLGDVRPGLELEVPLSRWNGVVRQVRQDRRLLGGVLLPFAAEEESLSAALANDRLFGELQRVVLEATTAMIEEGHLELVSPEGDGPSE